MKRQSKIKTQQTIKRVRKNSSQSPQVSSVKSVDLSVFNALCDLVIASAIDSPNPVIFLNQLNQDIISYGLAQKLNLKDLNLFQNNNLLLQICSLKDAAASYKVITVCRKRMGITNQDKIKD